MSKAEIISKSIVLVDSEYKGVMPQTSELNQLKQNPFSELASLYLLQEVVKKEGFKTKNSSEISQEFVFEDELTKAWNKKWAETLSVDMSEWDRRSKERSDAIMKVVNNKWKAINKLEDDLLRLGLRFCYPPIKGDIIAGKMKGKLKWRKIILKQDISKYSEHTYLLYQKDKLLLPPLTVIFNGTGFSVSYSPKALNEALDHFIKGYERYDRPLQGLIHHPSSIRKIKIARNYEKLHNFYKIIIENPYFLTKVDKKGLLESLTESKRLACSTIAPSKKGKLCRVFLILLGV
jgi:hypothetical protein